MADESVKINEEPEKDAVDEEKTSEEQSEKEERPVDELAEAKAEAAAMKDKWLRSEAEFANYKKRKEQERFDYIQYSEANILTKLLPILDDFERAFNSAPKDEKAEAWFAGFAGIQKKLFGLLESSNVTVIESVGKSFDPNLHEAVMQVPGEDGKVMQELQTGYKLFDRVLRHSKVAVGNGEPVPETK